MGVSLSLSFSLSVSFYVLEGPAKTLAETLVMLPGLAHLIIWSRGVTVSTLDSETSDRGSNPRETSNKA